MDVTTIFKVGAKTIRTEFNIEQRVEYTILLDPDEVGGTDYALPGLSSPKYIFVIVEDYDQSDPAVEVMFRGVADGERRPCTPLAVLMANVNGGMDSMWFEDMTPSLRFYNNVEEEVEVTVMAGQ